MTPREATAPLLHDLRPPTEQARAEILAGLRSKPKHLSPRFFYDERGSELFETICDLPEYYLTRTEIGIMRAHAADMADALGANTMVVELGSGSSVKTRLLLDVLPEPVAYVPVDISHEHLSRAASDINAAYPMLEVLPVSADFTRPFRLPTPKRQVHRVVVYFPGSTIGNFEPLAAIRLLGMVRALVGAGGALLIGVDLKKPVPLLEAAYNDDAGITAEFNRNMLAHVNQLTDASFDPEAFEHHAYYNARSGRVEMHLVSRKPQRIQVADQTIEFTAGESIHTENSYKYSLDEFAGLADSAGFAVERLWTDAKQLFSVQLLRANGKTT